MYIFHSYFVSLMLLWGPNHKFLNFVGLWPTALLFLATVLINCVLLYFTVLILFHLLFHSINISFIKKRK